MFTVATLFVMLLFQSNGVTEGVSVEQLMAQPVKRNIM